MVHQTRIRFVGFLPVGIFSRKGRGGRSRGRSGGCTDTTRVGPT